MANGNLVVPITEKVSRTVHKENKIVHLVPPKTNISVEERATMLLVRDLVRFGWRLRHGTKSKKTLELVPPDSYSKEVSRQAMAYSRNEILTKNQHWIAKHIDLARKNLASGEDVLKSGILPRFEICETDKARDIFRIFRYYWSSPYSEYVGRRIRLLIRDDSVKNSPVIGIAALGSSIIHITDRDDWIGWDTTTRTERIIYIMDAYILGAVPPYNQLLGGKLISYMLASNEIRQIYKEKYQNATTVIRNRQASDLVLIVTTSLYGNKSSQYNRINFDNQPLYIPIGETTGYGTLHISNETFEALRELLTITDKSLSNHFGSGANWRLRVIRKACEIMGLDGESILKHSFQRGLFGVPLATNWKDFLNGKEETPNYRNLPLADLINYWKLRWLDMRKKNDLILKKVKTFTPDQFQI